MTFWTIVDREVTDGKLVTGRLLLVERVQIRGKVPPTEVIVSYLCIERAESHPVTVSHRVGVSRGVPTVGTVTRTGQDDGTEGNVDNRGSEGGLAVGRVLEPESQMRGNKTPY